MAVKSLPSMAVCAGVFLLAGWAQPLEKGVVSGTVVDGESGDPIRKAVVTLTLEGSPRRWARARTDGSGHFEFLNLPAGRYSLRATKASDGTAIYGANSLRELGDLITLAEGETRGAITLRFIHSASVSGHVYDSEGEPVVNVTVNLLREGRMYRTSPSDERGEYRFSSVDPGRYSLHASANSRAQIDAMRLVDQYYGGARVLKEATPIHVGGGESLAGLDFHLISEPAVQVRGQVNGMPESLEVEPPGVSRQMMDGMNGPEVRISPTDAGLQWWSSATRAQGPEHRFQMPDVPAGRYRIEAILHSRSTAYGASQILDLRLGAGEIQLTLAPASDIQGTLVVEGRAAPGAAAASTIPAKSDGFRVQLTRPDSARGGMLAQVGADGRFSFTQVVPGEWQLSVTPLPPGFLKAAQFGDKDVRFTTFEAGSSSDTALKIVVSMRSATVEGEVEGGAADSKRAAIVIVPLGQAHNLTRYYYGGVADDNGKFKVGGIAPGKYKVLALEKMSGDNFRNPEAADQLGDLGEVIEVGEGTTFKTHPKLIPAIRAAKALQ